MRDGGRRRARADLHAGRGRLLRPASCTSTAARSSSAASTRTTTSRGRWRRRPGSRSSRSATGWRPRPPSRPACTTATAWSAGRPRTAKPCAGTAKTLAIAGDSSGGNFVAAVAAMAHDDGLRPASRTRCSSTRPSTWTSTSTATPRCGRTPRATASRRPGLKPCNSFYLDSGADPADPLVSPIKRADLTGLPPALIITAEYDPLRDEGELYGAAAEGGRRGRDRSSRYAGAGHGFVQHFSWIPEYYRAFEETARFLDAGAGQ